jgi:hypothetical protein
MKGENESMSRLAVLHCLLCLSLAACGWFSGGPVKADAARDPVIDEALGDPADTPSDDATDAPLDDVTTDDVSRDDTPADDVPDDDVPDDDLRIDDVPMEDIPGDDMVVDDVPGDGTDPVCQPFETSCSNALDDDCDTRTDCGDPDCVADPACCDDATCDTLCILAGYEGGTCGCNASACNCSLVYGSDFSGSHDWWVTTNTACEYSYVGARYYVTAKASSYLCWANAPAASFPASFTVEVDCTITTTEPEDGCGILYRNTSTPTGDTYYYFASQNRGRYKLWLHGTSWTTLIDWTDTVAIRGAGLLNRLGVTVRGSSMDFCVNGTYLTSHADDTLSDGIVSIAADNGTGEQAQAMFDNFVLVSEP